MVRTKEKEKRVRTKNPETLQSKKKKKAANSREHPARGVGKTPLCTSVQFSQERRLSEHVKWEESSRVTKVPFAESRRLLVVMESPSVMRKRRKER